MAKNQQTELAVKESTESAALATVPDDLVGGSDLAERGSDVKFPVLKLYQGTSEEASIYGEHPRGCWIDTVLMQPVDQPRVAVVGSMRVWTKFVDGQKFPVYVKKSIDEVPAADLAGDKYAPDKKDKPAAQEMVVAVVLSDTLSAYVMRFKSTGLRAWENVIDSHERNRGRKGLITGLYELGSEKSVGKSGKPYQRATARAAGDLPSEMHAAFRALKAEWAKSKDRIIGASVDADDDAAGHDDHETSSDVPF